MAMDVTRSQNTAAATKTAPAVLPQDAGVRRIDPAAASTIALDEPLRKAVGYGLPCAKCHLYYAADLDICPTCHHKERVSPVAPKASLAVQAQSESTPDVAVLEQERAQFLTQFKSQLLEAHAEVANGPATMCTLGENHQAEPEQAEICKPCYDHLQERLDVCEAALHMDMKEAAQIIYDAVWADPSDPSKTYRNAANALLTELRKRGGITALLGPFQPLSH